MAGLKTLLAAHGVNYAGCVEKAELVALAEKRLCAAGSAVGNPCEEGGLASKSESTLGGKKAWSAGLAS